MVNPAGKGIIRMSPRRNRPLASSTAGYTLAELIVVLVILGLATALIGPRVVGPSAARDLRTASQTLTDMAAQARNQAILSGQDTRLLVDVEAKSLRIEPGGASRKLPERVALTVTSAESERIDFVAGVRFFPDGSSTGASIDLEADGRPAREVRIEWVTGLATQVRP